MEEEILNIKNQALGQIMQTKSLTELENVQTEYLGKKGRLNAAIKQIHKIAKEDRKQAGIIINEAKTTIVEAINTHKQTLDSDSKEWFDATIPGIKPQIGHLHLVTQAINEISDVFEKIGFVRRRYPEVDWDWYAFGSLNFPENHPAWDEFETYFVDLPTDKKMGRVVLTPHTSNGQVREMEKMQKPPIRMVNISKTYRRQSDISHTPMFHQFEGLVIDEGISIANLKGTLDYFAKQYFGPDRKTRLRPYHFQFTEPSFEVDITCDLCNGAGCRMCKAGWLELGGAGMVHPNVLKAGGISTIGGSASGRDTKKYTGFAFGWGVERVLMMRSGINIPDLRMLYSADVRFLNQF